MFWFPLKMIEKILLDWENPTIYESNNIPRPFSGMTDMTSVYQIPRFSDPLSLQFTKWTVIKNTLPKIRQFHREGRSNNFWFFSSQNQGWQNSRKPWKTGISTKVTQIFVFLIDLFFETFCQVWENRTFYFRFTSKNKTESVEFRHKNVRKTQMNNTF